MVDREPVHGMPNAAALVPEPPPWAVPRRRRLPLARRPAFLRSGLGRSIAKSLSRLRVIGERSLGGKPGEAGEGGARGARFGGSGGSPPGKILRAVAEAGRRPASIERRRVATGANHPASHSSAFRRGPGTPAGAPTGDQSTAMHVTPKPPLVRQDRITNRSVQHQSCSVVQPFPGCFSDSVSWLNDGGGCGPGDVPSGEGLPAGHPAASGGM